MNTITAAQNPVQIPVGSNNAVTAISWTADFPSRLQVRKLLPAPAGQWTAFDPANNSNGTAGPAKTSGGLPSPSMQVDETYEFRLVRASNGNVLTTLKVEAVQARGIKVSENPVIFSPGVPQKSIRIDWSTGGPTVPGELRFQENGGAEQLIDPTDGSLQWRNGFNRTVFASSRPFTLKLYAKQSNELLASLQVTAQSQKESLTGLVPDVLADLGLVQAIRRLKIHPGPDYAEFNFTTTQPTVPILTVRTDPNDPNTNVAVAWSIAAGARTEHRLIARGLDQETTLFFELTAGGSPESAIVKGSLTTGWRDVSVTFKEVQMNRLRAARGGWFAGTPPSRGTFHFGVYRGPSPDGRSRDNDGEHLGPGRPLDSTPVYNLYEGLSTDVTRTFLLSNCPRLLSLWVRAFVDRSDDSNNVFDDISDAISGEPFTDGTRFYPPPHLPDPRSRRSHGQDDLDEWATAQHQFTLPDAPNDRVLTVGFGISSGEAALKFGVIGQFEIQSYRPPEKYVWSTFPKKKDGTKALAPGGHLPVPWPGRKVWLSLAPDGTLFQRPVGVNVGVDSPSGIAIDDWTPIGRGLTGALTVVPGDDRRLHLVGRGRSGTVLARTLTPELSPSTPHDWIDLGGPVRGRIAAITRPGGRMLLFGIAPDNSVYYRNYDGTSDHSAACAWVSLGGHVHESIAVASSPDGSVLELFALDCAGSVRHRSLRGSDWSCGIDEWENLGGRFDAPGSVVAAARSENGQLAVLVVGCDGRMHRKYWDGHDWSPGGVNWEIVEHADLVVNLPAENPMETRAMRDKPVALRANTPLADYGSV